MAGALDISLGGPRKYEGRVTDLAHMGDGEQPLTPGTVRKALVLYRLMLALFAALIGWLILGEKIGPVRGLLMILIAVGAILIEFG